MKELKNKLLKQIKINFMIIIYHKYILQVIQEQDRVKSPEVFLCAMVTWTLRVRCLENS